MWLVDLLFGHGGDRVAEHRQATADRETDDKEERVRASADRAHEVVRRLETQIAVLQRRHPRND